jgi:hypothetical protein
MTTGVPQADGTNKIEAVMDVDNVATTVLHMASLPPEANVLFVTVMATKAPFVGRGLTPEILAERSGWMSRAPTPSPSRTIWGIALGILIFAVGVVAWALAIGNTQLFKDGVDWVYDVALYGIAALVFGRDARAERLAALAIGAVMAVAGLHTLYDLWDKIVTPRPIEIWTLGFSAGSAIVIALIIVGAALALPRRGQSR